MMGEIFYMAEAFKPHLEDRSNTKTLPPRPALITADDLQDQSFSPKSIKRLLELKAVYPFVEYTDTNNQWQRLQFIKWRYQHGDLQRENHVTVFSSQSTLTHL